MTQRNDDFIEAAKDELSGMAKEGMHHPSTKPVLTGAAVGAVAGALLPVVSWPIGLAVGAGYMFYKRLRP
jgi:di/tricarboxylate transporter